MALWEVAPLILIALISRVKAVVKISKKDTLCRLLGTTKQGVLLRFVKYGWHLLSVATLAGNLKLKPNLKGKRAVMGERLCPHLLRSRAEPLLTRAKVAKPTRQYNA